MKNFTLLLILFFLTSAVFAQVRTVNGQVTGPDGLPVLGATVSIKNTSNGVSTDFDGKYQLQASSTDVLLFSYVGYQSAEVVVGDKTEINVTFSESLNELDKIIITGYSQIEKSRSTSATQIVDVDEVAGAPRASLIESLQGAASGLNVVSSTGQPGSTPSINIRGIGTFQGSSPLYVIDGFQTDDAQLIAQINPNDVASLQILKDAAGLAIYGTRAANGVIVITTKKGRSGEMRVSFSSNVGYSDPSTADKNKPLGTPELQELLQEGVVNAGLRPDSASALTFLTDNGFDPNTNTDWYGLLTQRGTYQEHNVSLSGGGDNATYYLSGGYQKTEGTIIASSNERMNVRLNMDIKGGERFRLSPRISLAKNIMNVRPDGGAFANPVRAIYRIRPDISPYNEDGTFNFGFNNTHNPIAQAEQEIRRNIDYRAVLSTNAEYDLFDFLTVRSEIALNYSFVDNFTRRPKGFGDARELGDGSQTSNFLFTWNWRNLLVFNRKWNDVHELDAFAGYEVIRTRNKFSSLSAENILNGFEDLANAAVPSDASTSKGIAGFNSVFANAEYAYDSKYLASFSIRRDGANVFGPNNRFGTFYSVGLGWNLAKEDFMSDVDWIDDLKLRSSFGQVGNANIGQSNFISIFSATEYNGQPGRFFSSFGNPDIKWETQSNIDIGLDFAFIRNRIQGSLNFYRQDNQDLLRDNFPVSASNGDTTVPGNIGAILNRGVELSIKSRNIVSQNNGFEWTTNLNFTKNENEVTELGNDNIPILGATSLTAVGEDVNTFYLPVYAGVDPANGRALFYTDGTRSATTYDYAQADQAIIGSSTPDWTAGLRNSFSYQGVGLSVNLYYRHGGLIYDTWARFTNSDGSRRLSDSGNVNRGTYDRRWQNPGDVTDVPAFVYGNGSPSSSSSSRFIYDGTYLRLRDIELSYDFQEALLDKVKLRSMRVYLRGSNLATYRKDDRLERDPEAGLSGRVDQEIPIPKTFLFGINVSL
ncbi:SusC/RagA family TonB-linked outer membrane protein [Nonlabens antarcticus]|uniref:SusC/RagA family TonB-linked outer membrane protein n=1 Tax=Nonlabens antarcticus TaxID=392714 RepID=UPI001890CDE4|nr:SusC/RagA family TonB-linked outer membrane protein [Nonlabens antarcticus]